MESQASYQQQINVAWVEKLLPQLILVSPNSPEISDHERKQLEACIKKAEHILSLKEHYDRLWQALVQAENFDSENPSNLNVTSFFARQSFVGDRNSPAGTLLYDLRMATAQKCLESLPKNVAHWLSDWEKRVDAAVCEAKINAYAKIYKKVEAASQSWQRLLRDSSRRKLGLFARLRVLRLSRRAKTNEKLIIGQRAIAKKLAAQVQEKKSRVARNCGLVSIFFRVPISQCGEYSQRVAQCVLLNLEKDLNVELQNLCQQMKRRVESLQQELASKLRTPRDLRKRILELESQKNSSLISLYSKRNVDLKQVLSNAAGLQVRVAFTEVESRMAQETKTVNDLQTQMQQMKNEIRRLSRIMDDHLNQVPRHDAKRFEHLASETRRTPAHANGRGQSTGKHATGSKS